MPRKRPVELLVTSDLDPGQPALIPDDSLRLSLGQKKNIEKSVLDRVYFAARAVDGYTVQMILNVDDGNVYFAEDNTYAFRCNTHFSGIARDLEASKAARDVNIACGQQPYVPTQMLTPNARFGGSTWIDSPDTPLFPNLTFRMKSAMLDPPASEKEDGSDSELSSVPHGSDLDIGSPEGENEPAVEDEEPHSDGGGNGDAYFCGAASDQGQKINPNSIYSEYAFRGMYAPWELILDRPGMLYDVDVSLLSEPMIFRNVTTGEIKEVSYPRKNGKDETIIEWRKKTINEYLNAPHHYCPEEKMWTRQEQDELVILYKLIFESSRVHGEYSKDLFTRIKWNEVTKHFNHVFRRVQPVGAAVVYLEEEIDQSKYFYPQRLTKERSWHVRTAKELKERMEMSLGLLTKVRATKSTAIQIKWLKYLKLKDDHPELDDIMSDASLDDDNELPIDSLTAHLKLSALDAEDDVASDDMPIVDGDDVDEDEALAGHIETSAPAKPTRTGGRKRPSEVHLTSKPPKRGRTMASSSSAVFPTSDSPKKKKKRSKKQRSSSLDWGSNQETPKKTRRSRRQRGSDTEISEITPMKGKPAKKRGVRRSKVADSEISEITPMKKKRKTTPVLRRSTRRKATSPQYNAQRRVSARIKNMKDADESSEAEFTEESDGAPSPSPRFNKQRWSPAKYIPRASFVSQAPSEADDSDKEASPKFNSQRLSRARKLPDERESSDDPDATLEADDSENAEGSEGQTSPKFNARPPAIQVPSKPKMFQKAQLDEDSSELSEVDSEEIEDLEGDEDAEDEEAPSEGVFPSSPPRRYSQVHDNDDDPFGMLSSPLLRLKRKRVIALGSSSPVKESKKAKM